MKRGQNIGVCNSHKKTLVSFLDNHDFYISKEKSLKWHYIAARTSETQVQGFSRRKKFLLKMPVYHKYIIM